MGDKRQKNQLQMVLAFTDEGRSEAPKARREGIESSTAKRRCESPAIPEQVMEEVCGRDNCLRALKRVNKGSPGIDGMKVSELPGYSSEPPYADPHVRWCGRGEWVTTPPMPIFFRERHIR